MKEKYVDSIADPLAKALWNPQKSFIVDVKAQAIRKHLHHCLIIRQDRKDRIRYSKRVIQIIGQASFFGDVTTVNQ